MKLTAAQQKYFAYWLTRSLPSDSLGKLTASLQDAQVDLTPHQIDAALFAFKSPLSKDAILADPVRLQRFIKDLEKRRSEKRLNLYQAQDDVDSKKEDLLSKVEAMLAQKIEQTKLVTFHWEIV